MRGEAARPRPTRWLKDARPSLGQQLPSCFPKGCASAGSGEQVRRHFHARSAAPVEPHAQLCFLLTFTCQSFNDKSLCWLGLCFAPGKAHCSLSLLMWRFPGPGRAVPPTQTLTRGVGLAAECTSLFFLYKAAMILSRKLAATG